jgi:hypothetical protein
VAEQQGEAPTAAPAPRAFGDLSDTREEAPHIESHLAKSIIATLLCCLPLGIVAIVHAAKVDGQRMAGDIQGAQLSSMKADSWGNWAIGSGLLLCVLYFFFMLAVVGL